MTRARTLFVTILPAAIAGGFLFASAFSRADAGRGALGFWPAAADTASGSVLVAQADPRPAPRYRGLPPPPPAPPAPPMPPVPTRRSHGSSHGMSVSIHDGKVEIDGIAELVQESLEKAADALDNLSDVPPDVRDQLKGRIRGMREKIRNRLGKLKSMDLDQIGPELERMGDEIEREMAGLDKDLAKLGDKVGKGFAKKFGKDFAKNFGALPGMPGVPAVPGMPGVPTVRSGPGMPHDPSDADDDDDDDDDDKDAVTVSPSIDIDMDSSDMGPAIAALKGLSLSADQRKQLAQLRADTDSQVQRTKAELDDLSNRLHRTLGEASASEADIARQIDSISAKEAAIRKVRILAWVKARNLLKKDQRKQVEAAVKSH